MSQRGKIGSHFWLLVILALSGSLLPGNSFCFSAPQPPQPAFIRSFQAAEDFSHETGNKCPRGWVVDYKKDEPGYVLEKSNEPLALTPGLFRATFYLARGTYPKKGLLHEAFGVFRLEIWDVTTGELINQRELEYCDFVNPNKLEPRWLEFSMKEREGHLIEPRIYWLGLVNAEIQKIEINRYPDVDLKKLEEKANRIGKSLKNDSLENGFVVSRKSDGSPDELGDATTYTGYYAASLAWKYSVTKSALTLQELENALATLHSSLLGIKDKPFLARFVDENGNPYHKGPSKDVYASFFLAYSVSYPLIKNQALKNQMEEDISKIGERFIGDDLTIKAGDKVCSNLTPYFTEEEIRSGLKKFLADEEGKKELLKNLTRARRLVPFYELWPGMKKTIKALKANDEDDLYECVLPTMNGIVQTAERVADILREHFRDSLFSNRNKGRDYPGKKLARFINQTLKKFPKETDGKRFQNPSDLKILASNSLLTLHIVKTAAVITGEYQFDNFYRNNLYAQNALLQCALDWMGADETFVQLTSGNADVDKLHQGILSTLALYNLIQLEENLFIKEKYVELLSRYWEANKNEDNPLAHALVLAGQKNKFKSSPDFILRALDEYPEDRLGLGNDFWKEQGKAIAETSGGGEDHGFSREPLPVSLRPRDSFLWQRNPRRLCGDDTKDYPGTDYLFLYWFSRYHKIIPATPEIPLAEQE